MNVESVQIHVRERGHGRDRRSRGRRFANNPGPTLCGAAPTSDDYSKADARHVIEHFSALRPEWVNQICPACRTLLA